MINMNYLLQLQQQDSITVADALNCAQQLIEKYLPMLRKVMQIRAQNPLQVDEPAFRAAKIVQSSVPQLYEMLEKLDNAIKTLEVALARGQHAKPDELHQLEIQIRDKLIKMLTAAVHHCETIYAQQSSSFAMILQDLSLLLEIIRSKLGLSGIQHLANSTSDMVIMDEPQDVPEIVLQANEKLVFIRIFHREMASLSTRKEGLQWIKPLLDSVKYAEKHGLAVYEHEADVVKSLKGDAYGYVTLKIKIEQDISSQRPTKVDQALGCRLLTIAHVEMDNMVKLTHHSVEYWIRDGMLHKIQ
ncbi:MAG: hypothetical protein ACK4PR_08015 [Gammaproteobacteria bacterium]